MLSYLALNELKAPTNTLAVFGFTPKSISAAVSVLSLLKSISWRVFIPLTFFRGPI